VETRNEKNEGLNTQREWSTELGILSQFFSKIYPFHNLGYPYLSPTPKAGEIVIAVLTVYETLRLLSLLCLSLDYFLYLIIITSLICSGFLCKQSLQII